MAVPAGRVADLVTLPTTLLIIVAIAAGLSALLTHAWLALARRRGIADAPGQRRLHATTTPRGGGIAIATVLVAAASGLALAQHGTTGALPWALLAAGLAGFAGVGLLDDLAPLGAAAKFGGQWLAAGALVAGMLLAEPDGFRWGLFALLALATVYLVNIWNFMDGSNGLVATQSLLVAVALALWPGQAPDLRVFGLVLAAGCLGFLPFNLPRARLFLGDVGSHVLGAGVVVIAAMSWRRGVVDLWVLGLLGIAMVLDSGLTLARRALNRRPVWRAHREHLYQYAVRSGHSHARVCVFYAAFTAGMWALARLSVGSRSSFVTPFSFILGLAFGLALYGLLRRRWLSPGMRKRKDGAGHE